MLKPYLNKLIEGNDLNVEECEEAMRIMITLESTEQIAAFLVLMRAKGETSEEMSAFVRVLRDAQVSVKTTLPICDIVGTGGDCANTANISTMASVLAASCGVRILKHGNRAVSSQSGAADVLEALGYQLERSPEEVAKSIEEFGIGFCYAPIFHPAMLALRSLRSRLKIPTFFNLMGPLLNPGHAQHIVMGVFDPTKMDLMADVLMRLNIKHAMVVHGSGLDELNCLGPCQVIEIKDNKKHEYMLDPRTLGFERCDLIDLTGGNAQYNAKLFEGVIKGKPSLLAETVILNAAAAVYVYGRTNSIAEAVPLVRENIHNGNASKTLQQFLGVGHE